MNFVLLRTILPRLASNRVVSAVIRHTGVAMLAGIGARIGGDLYDAFKKRAQQAPSEISEDAANETQAPFKGSE